jgi:prepilin-type processing-associated H-X9-DG protein
MARKNTIMIVETADPVPWTSPKDLSVEKGKPLPKFFPGGFLAAFADGHVEFIPPTAGEDELRAMIDPSSTTPHQTLMANRAVQGEGAIRG